jgi:hypothetical protein
MAKQLRVRPSDLYGIDEELTAWCFDRAVLTFGNALESKLQIIARNSKKQKEADNKVQRELDKWLASADPKTDTRRFADPMDIIRARKPKPPQ